jgi:hypothetical protein
MTGRWMVISLICACLVLWPDASAAQQTTAEAGLSPDRIPELLASGGDEDRARAMAAIRDRAEALASSPERATAWVQLLVLVEKSASESGALAARALLAVDQEGGRRTGTQLAREAEEAPEEDRAALLAFAAHLVEPEDEAAAADLRRRLLDAAPGAPEAPEARFALARYLAGPGGDRARARELLESLIVDGPNRPIAPAARRLLQELRSNPGGDG